MEQNNLWVVFPFAFVGLWLGVASILTGLSGWTRLQDRFPDRPEQLPVQRLRFQSASFAGSIPGGVQYGNCLTFDVCAAGLRVKLSKIFGPFVHPFFVPWSEISVAKRRGFLPFYLLRRYELSFGNPEIGKLVLTGSLASKIESASLGSFRLPHGD